MRSNEERLEQYDKISAEAREVFRKKNIDYGDSFAEHGTVGVLVRLADKLKRCEQISKTGIILVDDEKLKDTLLDLKNYATMALMLLSEEER